MEQGVKFQEEKKIHFIARCQHDVPFLQRTRKKCTKKFSSAAATALLINLLFSDVSVAVSLRFSYKRFISICL